MEILPFIVEISHISYMRHDSSGGFRGMLCMVRYNLYRVLGCFVIIEVIKLALD